MSFCPFLCAGLYLFYCYTALRSSCLICATCAPFVHTNLYSHCDKVVKEAQQSYPKLVNRKGSDVSRTPLERASIVGHKNFNQILKIMANTSSAFRATDCAGRLLVSDKISTINKAAKAKIVGAGTATAPESSASSPHNLPASAGDSHPNFKTALCRYGERCIYGERCRYKYTNSTRCIQADIFLVILILL